MTMKNLWNETAKRTGGAAVHHAPQAPAPRKVPMMTCEVLEPALWSPVDPLQPTVFPDPRWGSGTSTLDVMVGDVVASSFRPTDSAPWDAHLYALSLDAYELLVSQHGAEDTGETSGAFDTEGVAAMQEALPPAGMFEHPIHDWRGSLEVCTRVAEARGRHHGMSPESVASVTGRAYVPRKSLLATCGRARELEQQRAERDERAKAAEAQAVEIVAEAAREKTVGERRIVVFAVRRDRFGSAAGLEPWYRAPMLWQTEEELFFGFKAVLAVHAMPFARDSIRLLYPHELVPAFASEVNEPGRPELEFLHATRVEAGLNFGPVTALQTTVPLVALELIAAHAPALMSASPQLFWRTTWIAEVLVRSELRCRADVALQALLSACDFQFRKGHPPITVPTAGPMVRDFEGNAQPRENRTIQTFEESRLPSRELFQSLGAECVRATQAGSYVSVGEPLDASVTEKAHEEASTTLKKRSK